MDLKDSLQQLEPKSFYFVDLGSNSKADEAEVISLLEYLNQGLIFNVISNKNNFDFPDLPQILVWADYRFGFEKLNSQQWEAYEVTNEKKILRSVNKLRNEKRGFNYSSGVTSNRSSRTVFRDLPLLSKVNKIVGWVSGGNILLSFVSVLRNELMKQPSGEVAFIKIFYRVVVKVLLPAKKPPIEKPIDLRKYPRWLIDACLFTAEYACILLRHKIIWAAIVRKGGRAFIIMGPAVAALIEKVFGMSVPVHQTEFDPKDWKPTFYGARESSNGRKPWRIVGLIAKTYGVIRKWFRSSDSSSGPGSLGVVEEPTVEEPSVES